jgi:hypothetical protein
LGLGEGWQFELPSRVQVDPTTRLGQFEPDTIN